MRTLTALLVAAAVLAGAGDARTVAAPAPAWFADFGTGLLDEFAPVTATDADPVRPKVVRPAGRYLAEYRITAGGARSQTVPDLTALQRISDGDELWFAWRMWVPADLPLGSPGFQGFAEWKNPGLGAAPLALLVGHESTDFRAEGGFSHPDGNRLSSANLGPVQRERWITWLWHVRFATDPARGVVDVWRDGVQVVAGWQPAGGTLYPARAADGSDPNRADGTYVTWKLGYFRSPTFTTDTFVWIDAARAGYSRASVELATVAQ